MRAHKSSLLDKWRQMSWGGGIILNKDKILSMLCYAYGRE